MGSVHDFPWSDYEKWLTPPSCHEEDGCAAICHAYHLEEHIFEDECEFCEEEKCRGCNGNGWTPEEESCLRCQGAGRIKENRGAC